jgi:hypothetical protein
MFVHEFELDPPGLATLNRLAVCLNAMKVDGSISDWHFGGKADRLMRRTTILFESKSDRIGAVLRRKEERQYE